MRILLAALAAVTVALSPCTPGQASVSPHPIKVIDKGIDVYCFTTGKVFKIRTCNTYPVITALFSDGTIRVLMVSRAEMARCQRRETFPCR